MTSETSQLLNALKQNSVRWSMEMMNLSIALGELGRVAKEPSIVEACMVKAKKAYGTALTKGKRSFTAAECSDFEYKSFRAETLIAELEGRLTSQQAAPRTDESLAS